MRHFDNFYKFAAGLHYFGILAAVTAFFYVTFLEGPFLSYTQKTFIPLGGPFHPGDTVPLQVTRCNSDSRRHSYAVTHTLQSTRGGTPITLPEVYVQIEPGCKTAASRINILPKDLALGTYRIFGGGLVYGTVRTFDVEWSSDPFEVTAGE